MLLKKEHPRDMKLELLLERLPATYCTHNGKFVLLIPDTFTIEDATLLCTAITKNAANLNGYIICQALYSDYFSVVKCNNPEVEAFVNLYLLSL